MSKRVFWSLVSAAIFGAIQLLSAWLSGYNFDYRSPAVGFYSGTGMVMTILFGLWVYFAPWWSKE